MFKLNAVSLAVAAAVTAIALPVLAQDQQLERVVVTGSAIKRIDAETAVPVTVIKFDDLKAQGITSIEQVMTALSSVQMQTGTSQVVGAGTGGASFADMRGIGANKTLVLLNGRRVANNALDSSAPDLNAIPFAAIQRVELLRDGASALYGTDAIGGVINFITRKDFTGGTITVGTDSPQHKGGKSNNANIGYGFGELDKQGFNIFGFLDYQNQDRILGPERGYNDRAPGGISPTPYPGNYYQAGDNVNPAAPDCTSSPNLVPDGASGCNMATAAFVNYIPKTERISGMLKGTLKLNENHQLGLEYFGTRSEVDSVIAPVPYGALRMNRTLADGSLNPYYPGNPGSSITTPNIPLSPTFGTGVGESLPAGTRPGYITVKWRDLFHGPRNGLTINEQQRLVASAEGAVAGWDYQTAISFNENKLTDKLAGYSDGNLITQGVLNGVINPFGAQSAAGTALLEQATLAGTLQTAKGTVTTIDARASRELSDWFGAGRPAALAIGAEARQEKFKNAANVEFAEKVIASTGFDPATYNAGDRDIYAAYAELNVPLLKTLDVTAAVRYDNYSDFGNTTNPKFSFRFQPNKVLLVRGSYSTGFRAPSLYEIHAAPYYTNTSQFDDPINCPGGTAIPGKPAAANCQQQFQALYGGNDKLKPEKAKNGTLGFVIEPAQNLSIGADLWWVSVEQQIGSISDVTVFSDPAKYAALFHRNPGGNLSTDGSECPDVATCGYIDLRTQNLGGVSTRGVDLSAAYKLRAGSAGDFGFTLQSTYITKYKYQNEAGGEWVQNVGVYSGAGPIFRWQHNANVSWSLGSLAAGFAAHYKSGYVDQNADNEGNKVGGYATFDAYGTWMATKAASLTLGIRNLADKEAPYSNQTAVFQANYDPRFADAIGRTYYVRGNYKF
jgi:iron complex outermembrane receptor protein